MGSLICFMIVKLSRSMASSKARSLTRVSLPSEHEHAYICLFKSSTISGAGGSGPQGVDLLFDVDLAVSNFMYRHSESVRPFPVFCILIMTTFSKVKVDVSVVTFISST